VGVCLLGVTGTPRYGYFGKEKIGFVMLRDSPTKGSHRRSGESTHLIRRACYGG